MKELVSIRDHSSVEQDLEVVYWLRPVDYFDRIALVAAEYVQLGAQISSQNAWKWGKATDAFGGLQDVEILSDRCGLGDSLISLLRLMTFSADIGRLVIAIEHAQGDKSRTQAAHGAASVEVLNRLHILDSFEELGLSIALAIEHHSDIKTPTLADFNGNEIAWTLCCLLRDLDMLSIISGKAFLYVEHPEERKRQLESNKLEMYGVTPEILEQFERGEPIDRLKCETFTDWLLQFLAWRANFTFQETWDMAVESRGYYFVLRWIRKHVAWISWAQPILQAAKEQYGLYYADLS